MGFEEFGARGGERRKGNKAPAWVGIFFKKKSFYELFFPSAFFFFNKRKKKPLSWWGFYGDSGQVWGLL